VPHFFSELLSERSALRGWDAENRLTGVTPMKPAAGSKKAVLSYDYFGRRVKKQVLDWNPSLNGGAGG
jgi:hypothetical protein